MATTCTLLLAAGVLAQGTSLTERLGWMLPQEVSQSDEASSQRPQLAVEDDGDLHLLWMDNTSGQLDPYYVASTNSGSSWSAGERFATAPQSYQGAIAKGTGDILHTCWWERTGFPQLQYLLYAQKSASNWGPKETVVVTNSQFQEPLVAEAADYVHIIWSNKKPAQDFDLFYTRKANSDSTWTDAVAVSDTLFSSLYARMAVAEDGTLHVVWQENISPTNEIMYISGTVGAGQTTWSDSITITDKVADNATSPHVAVNEHDVAHVVFGVDVAGQPDTQDVYHASFPISDTGAISPTLVDVSRVLVSQQLPTYSSPAIACDGPDDLHLVWNGVRGTDLWDRIYYTASHDGGETWSQPIVVSTDDAWPDGFPAVSTDGNLIHIAWQQKGLDPDNDIYYSHGLPLFCRFALAFKGY
jgi:hypothetical protein